MDNRQNKEKKIIGVLISGRGSNLKAILDSIESGYLNVKVGVVISNRKDAPGLKYPREVGIANFVISRPSFQSNAEFEEAIIKKLREFRVELVVLAGFMKVLSSRFVNEFYPNIINIHPSLLPSFKGLNAQRQAINYGVKITGCTVHVVSSDVDSGPIILQAAVGVGEKDTEETLSQKILKMEHKILPMAIKLWSEGRLKLIDRKVKIIGKEGFIIGQ